MIKDVLEVFTKPPFSDIILLFVEIFKRIFGHNNKPVKSRKKDTLNYPQKQKSKKYNIKKGKKTAHYIELHELISRPYIGKC